MDDVDRAREQVDRVLKGLLAGGVVAAAVATVVQDTVQTPGLVGLTFKLVGLVQSVAYAAITAALVGYAVRAVAAEAVARVTVRPPASEDPPASEGPGVDVDGLAGSDHERWQPPPD